MGYHCMRAQEFCPPPMRRRRARHRPRPSARFRAVTTCVAVHKLGAPIFGLEANVLQPARCPGCHFCKHLTLTSQNLQSTHHLSPKPGRTGSQTPIELRPALSRHLPLGVPDQAPAVHRGRTKLVSARMKRGTSAALRGTRPPFSQTAACRQACGGCQGCVRVWLTCPKQLEQRLAGTGVESGSDA